MSLSLPFLRYYTCSWNGHSKLLEMAPFDSSYSFSIATGPYVVSFPR